MKKLFKNRKGAEEYLSPWMFLVWIIIAVAIVIGVIIFNATKVDVREKEADILGVRVLDCLVDNGYIAEEFLEKDKEFNIYEKCGLDEKILSNGHYWLNISVYGSEGLIKDFTTGVQNFEMLCELGKESKGEDFPKCSEKKIYALRKNNEIVAVNILTASNQPLSEL